ncbi:MAG: hypothetical protein R2713_20375 [Ilumatobacteraceae bacterium]
MSGLLGLVGIDADPLSSREHILLSNLIMNEWSNGRSLDLPTLVGMALTPPIRKLGVFELDSFFRRRTAPRCDATRNGLLASPSFAAWMSGVPLDMETMLRTPDGRPRCARHHRPPERRGAAVRHHARVVEAGHVDAPSERHHRPARPCSTWTRSPATCHPRPHRRRRSRS